MARPEVTVVIPVRDSSATIGTTIRDVARYLDTTGFGYELIVVDDGSADETSAAVKQLGYRRVKLLRNDARIGKGASLKRGVLESNGDVVVFIDDDFPFTPQSLGDAIAVVHSESADVAIGSRALRHSLARTRRSPLRRITEAMLASIGRTFLFGDVSDPLCGLKAFSLNAAKLLFAESRIGGFGFDYEILFLARKYGFYIEEIAVAENRAAEQRHRIAPGFLQILLDVYRIRMLNRSMTYRSARRCPVCFSTEVWSLTQIRGNVLRVCNRCKCRYLGKPPSEEEIEHQISIGRKAKESSKARTQTYKRRVAMLRRFLPASARLLEVGAGAGELGALARNEFDYVGIDPCLDSVREARANSIEMYRGTISSYVNTGGAFDAITMFNVLEQLVDPHDALGRAKDLLKPGGYLVVVTPDTESILASLAGIHWTPHQRPVNVILYSRSALIELLERSGFEIVYAHADFAYHDRDAVKRVLEASGGKIARGVAEIVRVLPDPLRASGGSIRIVARRRTGAPVNFRAVPSMEATHAR